MVSPVRIPTLGLVIKNVNIIAWKVKEGDKVTEGDPLLAVETDKITFDVMSPASGILLKVFFGSGSSVKVEETVVAVIGQDGEDYSEYMDDMQSGIAKVDPQPVKEYEKTPQFNATPAAKRLARKYGIKLEKVKSKNLNSLITRKEIEAFYQEEIKNKSNDYEQVDFDNNLEQQIIPFVGTRKTIAENMIYSKNVAAHVTTLDEIDMTDVITIRAGLEKELKIRISMVTFIVKAAVRALEKFPIINSVLDNDMIIIKKYVHAGIAVATEKGLIVPVIRDAHKKNFVEIAIELEKIVNKTRDGNISPQMMQDGTITISNAGPFGSLIATPIINQPQSALIWTGRIAKKPVVVNSKICIRSMMYLCISYDHRVMDGAIAAQYLQQVKVYLQNPALILTNYPE